MQDAIDADVLKRRDSLEELERDLGLAGRAHRAMAQWNDACERGEDDFLYPMPAEWLHPIVEPPFYGCRIGGNLYGEGGAAHQRPDAGGGHRWPVIRPVRRLARRRGCACGENSYIRRPILGSLMGDVGARLLRRVSVRHLCGGERDQRRPGVRARARVRIGVRYEDMKAMARPFFALYAMALVVALLGRIGLAVARGTGVLAFDYISASGVPVLDVICSILTRARPSWPFCSRLASRFACRRPARCSTARWPRGRRAMRALPRCARPLTAFLWGWATALVALACLVVVVLGILSAVQVGSMSSKLPGLPIIVVGVIGFAAFLGTLLGAASMVVCACVARWHTGHSWGAFAHRGGGGVRRRRRSARGRHVLWP